MRYVILAPHRWPMTEPIANLMRSLIDRHGYALINAGDRHCVLVAPGTPFIVDPRNGAVIIGHLFDGAVRITHPQTQCPVPIAPAACIADLWGGYIGVMPQTDGVEVWRDPSGAVPCYHLRAFDADIVMDDTIAITAGGLIAPQIDWTILIQSLAFRDLRPARTALRGIDEILPGMALHCTADALRLRCLWSPWTYTSRNREIAQFEAAVVAVEQATRRCVRAWGDSFDAPLVEISGGVDSAIVAAGLSGGRVRPRALTFGPAPGDPDETPYAQAVAERLNLPLERLALDPYAIDLTRSRAARLPRPTARSFSQSIDRSRQALAAALGADAIFSGGGGDNVFCNQQSALPVIDHLRRHGLTWGIAETAADIAALAHATIWQVAGRAIERLSHPHDRCHWPVRAHYLSTDALRDLPFPAGHPWVEAPLAALPGKRAHVMTLIGIQNHLEARSVTGEVPIISPLLSQPVMEACLSVPTWLWCLGGHNRAVARAAFSSVLPSSVIGRRSKGAFDSFCAGIITLNRKCLRDMLMEGSLAREGVLDRAAIDRDLASGTLDAESGARLLALADVEAWVRGWEGPISAVPA